jgi:hypothetical protein
MRDITMGQKAPTRMSAKENSRSLTKWTKRVSSGEMGTVFISVGAYYALYPTTEDITRMSRKG